MKPRHESISFELQIVDDPKRLRPVVETVVAQYRQDALVEKYIEGRDICVAILGNDEPEALPFVEHDFGQCAMRLITWWDKMHQTDVEPRKI